MSAVIKIETEDKMLASLLTIVIAAAVNNAGFNNTAAKLVTISAPVRRGNGFDRVNQLIATPEEGIVNPPELRDLVVVMAPDSFVTAITSANPDILAKPVLLDAFKNTCEKYEQDAASFLSS